MNIRLLKETQLLFFSEPVIFKKEQLKNIENFLNKKIKEYQVKQLISFTKYDLQESMIYEKSNDIIAKDFYITDYNSSVLFISNLKSVLTKKEFKYIRENLAIDFYSVNQS